MNSGLMAQLKDKLWQERATLTRWQRLLIRCGRYSFALVRDLLDGELSMRAMSLVYTTLLSIVPLLALGFSVLKALGAHNSLEPVLEEFLSPLGPQATEISAKVISFVEKIQVGVLGSLGVALLFYTAISLIQKVEASFNFIWRIEHPRPLAQRIGEYLGVLMVGPVLVFAALGITASILNSGIVASIATIEPFGGLIFAVTRLIPYVIIVALFSFMYMFLVHARVGWRASIAGGLAAGLLWQTSSVLFASFVANASNYNAVYSSFAIIIFLLIWLYVGWLILLVGCQLAFYVRNPRHLEPARRLPQMPAREAEHLGLLIMAITSQHFMRGDSALTEDDLVRGIDAPPENVTRSVQGLIADGYLVESVGKCPMLIPARDPGAILMSDLWKHLRSRGSVLKVRGDLGRGVASLLDSVESRFDDPGTPMSLRGWLLSLDKPGKRAP